MQIISFGGTDPGKKRNNNEDAFLVNDSLYLYAAADGIGGNEGGEVASRIAVETIAAVLPDLLSEKDRTPPAGFAPASDRVLSGLQQALALANKQIRIQRADDPVLASMGTTLTALLIRKERACIANIGDSRCYLLREEKLQQLTHDHSFVAEYVATGIMTKDEARMSPYRHVITRALGIDDPVEPEFIEHQIHRDDRFLLCTDGLTEMLSDSEIKTIISTSSPEEAVKNLLHAANDQGGVDNITAVVVWVKEL
ncbi:MAG: Stp1/IreP family PP2C-type Ser/Thr phosphatase [Nitrospirota bacterium]